MKKPENATGTTGFQTFRGGQMEELHKVEVEVVIVGLDPRRAVHIMQAIERTGPIEEWSSNYDSHCETVLWGKGTWLYTTLFSKEKASMGIAEAVWEANRTTCSVTVKFDGVHVKHHTKYQRKEDL